MYDPAVLAKAIGGLLQVPEPVDVRHMVGSRVTVAERLAHLRTLLRRGSFSFDEAVARADRVTVAVTLYARARALQAGRGELDPGGAVRRDHDRARRRAARSPSGAPGSSGPERLSA